MKKIIKFLTVLFAVAFFAVACGDDEGPKNQVSVEGDSYALANGYTALYGQGEDDDGNTIYGHYVVLTSKDITVSNAAGIEGKGELMMFLIISSADDIAAGTYEMGTTEAAGVFGQLIFYTGYDDDNETIDHAYTASEGTIKVSKSGNKTTFRIDITEFTVLDGEDDDTPTEGEGSIKGYFKGELEVLQDDDDDLRSRTVDMNVSILDYFKK